MNQMTNIPFGIPTSPLTQQTPPTTKQGAKRECHIGQMSHIILVGNKW